MAADDLGIRQRQFEARKLLNSGCAAIADGNPGQAEQDFREAKRLEPENVKVRIYISLALSLQGIPGAPESRHLFADSERELLECLTLDLSADDRRIAEENLTAVRYMLDPTIGYPLGK